VDVQKRLKHLVNHAPMIRPVCLTVIVAVMADQVMYDGYFMGGFLRMFADILAHI